MKVLLIKGNIYDSSKRFFFPPTSNAQLDTQSLYSPPLGLLYIGSCLEEVGHDVEIIDCFHEKKPMNIINKSLTSADIVGLSIFSDYVNYSNDVANMIKNTDSNIPIIIGGPHSTFFHEKAFDDIPSADVSIVGDGEYATVDTINAIDGDKKLSEVHGIYYKENGKIKKGKPPKLIENLDSLPLPSRDLVEKYEYGKLYGTYFRKPRFTCLATSRGCPYRCRFCNHIFSPLQKYRKRSVNNVIKEFVEINDKYNSVYIIDDSFFTDSNRVSKIMNELIEHGTDFELYIYGGRVGFTDREVYKKMKKAGVQRVFYGLESGNQDILDFYNKGITLDQIRKSIELAHEMDFFCSGSFIFGAPNETKEHIEKTIKFGCSLPLDSVFWRHLIYEYGSSLWQEAINNKIINESDGMFVWADSDIGLGNFTKEELDDFCTRAFIRFYFRPQYIIKEFLKLIRKKDFATIKRVFKFF